MAVTQHLPHLAGIDQVWVLVQQGAEWQALSGDTRGVEEVLQWGDLAQELLTSHADRTPTSLTTTRATSFPLIVVGGAARLRPEVPLWRRGVPGASAGDAAARRAT